MLMTTSVVPGASSAAASNPFLAPAAHPRRLVLTAVATVLVLVAVGFLLRLVPLDVGLSRVVHRSHLGALGAIAEGFYRAVKPVSAAGIMVVATAVVGFATRRWQAALAFVGTIALTWGSAEAIKLVVERPRPGLSEQVVNAVGTTADPSFPSGHVAFVAAFAAALICVSWATRWRALAIGVGVVLVAAMMLSVVYIGVHYVGDAVASVIWVAGIFPAVRALLAFVVARAQEVVDARRR